MHPDRRRIGIEGGLLLAAAPFLLFPAVFWPGTLLALLLLAGLWLWPLPAAGERRRWVPASPFTLVLLLWSAAVGVGVWVTADADLTLPKATGLLLGLTVWRTVSWVGGRDARLRRGLVGGYVLLGLGFVGVGLFSAEWLVKVPALARLLPPRLLALPGAAVAGIQMNQLAATILLLLPLVVSRWLGGSPAAGGAAPGAPRGRWRWL
ncbi:MAG: hypothetical protein KC425_26915, partial [Anaerolineales bacterium]|nr:hypothetical protein [Anaerolineales bacterium]